jgi:mono/diheme cytochrome c family protein
MRARRRATFVMILGAVLLLENGALAVWLGARHFRTPQSAPLERGRRVAERLGCFTCHGPDGGRGVPNPGSRSGNVPVWRGGTLMMFAESDAEISEWILDGAPRRLRAQPDFAHERAQALLAMPAFRGKVEGRDFEDLLAFFRAVAAADPVDDVTAARGREIAVDRGCFGCHGPQGRGNASNPGSFKGYIPSWDGPDFPDLVQSDAELREWILDGSARRLREHPIARHFLAQQAIRMPAFRPHLGADEVDALVAYIHWLRGASP